MGGSIIQRAFIKRKYLQLAAGVCFQVLELIVNWDRGHRPALRGFFEDLGIKMPPNGAHCAFFLCSLISFFLEVSSSSKCSYHSDILNKDLWRHHTGTGRKWGGGEPSRDGNAWWAGRSFHSPKHNNVTRVKSGQRAACLWDCTDYILFVPHQWQGWLLFCKGLSIWNPTIKKEYQIRKGQQNHKQKFQQRSGSKRVCVCVCVCVCTCAYMKMKRLLMHILEHARKGAFILHIETQLVPMGLSRELPGMPWPRCEDHLAIPSPPRAVQCQRECGKAWIRTGEAALVILEPYGNLCYHFAVLDYYCSLV